MRVCYLKRWFDCGYLVTAGTFSKTSATSAYQRNNTNYRRQKAHVNVWNKADICAETSTTPFPRCLQNVADISRTTVGRPSFRSLGDAGASGISAKTRNIHYGNQMNDIQGLPLFFLFFVLFFDVAVLVSAFGYFLGTNWYQLELFITECWNFAGRRRQ